MKNNLQFYSFIGVLVIAILVIGSILGIRYLNKENPLLDKDLQEIVVSDKAFSANQQPDSERLLIVTGEYPPYVSDSIEGGGLHYELVDAIMSELGLDYRIEYYPWARCVKMVQDGEAFGTFPWSKSDDRINQFYFTEPLFIDPTESFVLFYYKPNLDLSDLDGAVIESFRDYNVGGLFDYFYVPIFEGAGYTLDMSAEEREVYEKLISGRVDMLPADKYVSHYLIEKYYPDEVDNFAYIEVPFLERGDNYSIMVDIDNIQAKWFIEVFNKGLEAIKANGTYDEIVRNNHYFGE